jgi:hypothetical protein
LDIAMYLSLHKLLGVSFAYGGRVTDVFHPGVRGTVR